MIDIRCESAPWPITSTFVGLANDLAQQLAKGPGAATPDELLDQPSPSRKGTTLRQQFDDLNNRIREKFVLERILRVNGPAAGYVHHNGAIAALLHVEKAAVAAELARDICMHIVGKKPIVLGKEDVDPALVAKERDILEQAMAQEAEKIKTEAERILALPDQQIQDPNNLERMTSSHGRARGDLKKAEGMAKNKSKVIEGRLNQFYAERCLLDQTPCQRDQVRRQDDRRTGQGGRHEDHRFRALGTAQGVIPCLHRLAHRAVLAPKAQRGRGTAAWC